MPELSKTKFTPRKDRGIYPWTTMEVGQEFIIPWKPEGTRSSGASHIATANIKYAPKKWDFMHTTNGIHIYRVA